MAVHKRQVKSQKPKGKSNSKARVGLMRETKKPKGKSKPRTVALEPIPEPSDENQLNGRQRVFVNEYLKCWNATEAAKRAKYKGNRVTLASVGYENLRKPQIAELIAERMSEMAMASNEVLARFAEYARGNLVPFVTPEGLIDIKTDEARTHLHLVKKYKVRERSWFDEDVDGDVSEVTTEIELHDPQTALVHLGKHLKLFTDKVEHSGSIRHITFDVKYDDEPGGTDQPIHDPSAPSAPAPA